MGTDDSDSSDTSPEAVATELLNQQDVCTLATASADAVPEAATVRFVADDDYNIYVNTHSTYRKYENMMENPQVAVVVTRLSEDLQLEGRAVDVTGTDKEAFVREAYVEKYGRSKYLNDEDAVFIKIETDWARLLVDGQYPPTYEMLVGDGETDPHEDSIVLDN